MTRRVVVGLDESSTAQTALAWALEVAACWQTDLEAVHVWRWELPAPLPMVPDLPTQLVELAESTAVEQVERALARRPAGAPPVRARARTAEGDPGPALVAAAADAELLVLGRHGQSSAARRLIGQVLGSVAGHCLSRSPAPVVIVPDGAPATVPRRVVVGMDGSHGSARALQWAHRAVRHTGSDLVAVLAWQLTSLPAPSSWTGGAVPSLPEWHALAERLLDNSCRAALGTGAQGVEQVVLHEPAAVGLLAAAQRDDLLVLGDRGRGGFSRLLLGSVSRQCAEYACCPVVVVPSRDRTVAPVA